MNWGQSGQASMHTLSLGVHGKKVVVERLHKVCRENPGTVRARIQPGKKKSMSETSKNGRWKEAYQRNEIVRTGQTKGRKHDRKSQSPI